MVHLFEGIIPPLIPLLMVQFGVNYFRIGLVATAFTYLFGLGALPAGFLVDRLGARRLVSIFFLGAGLLSIMTLFVNSYGGYLVLMALVGVAASVYHPAGLTLISQETVQRGRAFGIHGIGGSLGIALAPMLAAFMGSRFGWRTPHVVFGTMGIILGVWSVLHGAVPAAAHRAHAESAETKERPTRSAVATLLLMYLSFAALGLAYRGITTFLPAYMAQNVTIGGASIHPVVLGGTVATIALLSGMLGQYIGGTIADRVSPLWLYTSTTLLAGVLALLMALTSGLILVIFAVLQAFFAFSSQPVQNVLVSRYLSRKNQGRAFGVKYLMIFGVGSFAAALAGFLADRFGLASVFVAMSVCYFLGSLLVIAMGRIKSGA